MSQSEREFLHSCPLCNERIYLLEVHFGTEVPCPHCGEHFTAQADAVVRDVETRRELALDAPLDPVAPRTVLRRRASHDGRPDAPAVHACGRCGRKMELLPEHADLEVPCPHCGERFVPERGDVVPGPRATGSRPDGTSPQATLVLLLGIGGLAGAFSASICCITLPLMACSPIGLFIGHRERKAVKARRAKDPTLEAGYWLCVAGTVLIALGMVGVALYALFVGVLVSGGQL